MAQQLSPHCIHYSKDKHRNGIIMCSSMANCYDEHIFGIKTCLLSLFLRDSGFAGIPPRLRRALHSLPKSACSSKLGTHFLLISAEEEGFEPPVHCCTTVFKTAAIDHSAIPPNGSAKIGKIYSFAKNFQ